MIVKREDQLPVVISLANFMLLFDYLCMKDRKYLSIQVASVYSLSQYQTRTAGIHSSSQHLMTTPSYGIQGMAVHLIESILDIQRLHKALHLIYSFNLRNSQTKSQ